MAEKKEIIFKNVITDEYKLFDSISSAAKWCFEQKLSKSKISAKSTIFKGLQENRVIYRKYIIRYNK